MARAASLLGTSSAAARAIPRVAGSGSNSRNSAELLFETAVLGWSRCMLTRALS